jgi:Cytochrome P460
LVAVAEVAAARQQERMRKLSNQPQTIRICTAAILLACAITVFINTSTTNARSDSESGKFPMVEEVSGYKTWTKVNPVPLHLPVPLDGLCAIPTERNLIQTSSNPHRIRQKFFTVYVNEPGRSAMMSQAIPNFPNRTVIVKEKLVTRDSKTPELLTVMIKREKGFNPESGDWEYMVLNGTGTNIQARGNLEQCQSCHVMNKSTDYVFRSYLPDALRSTLK